MPTDRRNRNYGEEPQRGRSSREASRSATGDQLREAAGAVGGRLQEGYDLAREELGHRYRRAEGMMARNPTPAVLISLGVGFGLGLVLTNLLARPEETWYDWADRRREEGMHRARHSMKHAHEAIHHAEAAARQLPDTFQALAESIRQLPEAIARHLPSSMTHR